MKLSGRRQSSNIEDRRRSGGKVAAGGIGAVIVAALIAWISGGNPLEVVMGNAGQLLGGGTSQQQAYVPTVRMRSWSSLSARFLPERRMCGPKSFSAAD